MYKMTMPHKMCLCQFILLSYFYLCNSESNFKIFWNIPTFMCKKYQILFDKLPQEYGIIQNTQDNFRGEEISILYDPGKFPAILYNPVSNNFVYRNHGVPQKGNLSEHLDVLNQEVKELIPSCNFSGLAILDFESWRPIFRQNFGTLKPYKELSMQIEQKNHPLWPKSRIEKEAKFNFELAAKKFMFETLVTVRKLRPEAKWGYYAFPYCFNRQGVNADQCAKGVKEENHKIKWMFHSSQALYPSIYLQESVLPSDRVPLVRGRIVEAVRASKMTSPKPEVFAYHRYVYTDTLKYIKGQETINVLSEIKQQGGNGAILWGSSNDLNTREKCQQFQVYLKEELGPAVRVITQQ